jgi:hypothetical protein
LFGVPLGVGLGLRELVLIRRRVLLAVEIGGWIRRGCSAGGWLIWREYRYRCPARMKG